MDDLMVAYRAVGELIPYARNARTHSKKQIRQIANSITRFGFTNPVLTSDAGDIIAGHGRVAAAQLLGLEKVPTVCLSHLTEAERRAYVLADNKLALNAGWDRELLAIELQGLVDLQFDVELTGFSLAEVDLILDEASDADPAKSDAPEDEVPLVTGRSSRSRWSARSGSLHPGKRITAVLGAHQCCQCVRPLAKIHRARRDHHARAGARADHRVALSASMTLFGFVDRQLLTLAAAPLAASLHLSDGQLGLVQGVAFAIFTVAVVYPIAWAADRFDRRLVIGGCVIVWSLGTAACGLAQNFGQLFAAAVAIAAGEAGLAPIAMSFVPDLFKGRKRLLANGLVYIFAYVGIAAGMMLGGGAIGMLDTVHDRLPAALRHYESWRLAFFLVALPAPVFLLLAAFARLGHPQRVATGAKDAGGHFRTFLFAKPYSPFRCFNSAPENIRLVVLMNLRFPLRCET